jgi:putative ABC transport system permease protein
MKLFMLYKIGDLETRMKDREYLMFFLTYLRRELFQRKRQAIVVALGFALGVGLVITVIAASSGVGSAQAGVLRSLYGVGTNITVTKAPPPVNASNGLTITAGPDGAEVCNDGHCSSGAQTIDRLTSPTYGAFPSSTVTSVAKLRRVAAAAGGLYLTDTQMTIPAGLGTAGGGFPTSTSFTVEGVDPDDYSALGPLSDGTTATGRNLRGSDAHSDVAVVDAGYATSRNLRAGSTITIASRPFTVVGTVAQPAGANPPDIYIPLADAQALGKVAGKSLRGDVNVIYVATTAATTVPAVRSEITALAPTATVTTSSSLASQVSGSLASTASLANDLGRWLSVLVLIAAFAVASLLTMAAVSRRAREFGTLKALGWRSRRIIAQVLGESAVTGVIGAAAGVGLGFAGAAIITAAAGKLSATVQTATGQHFEMTGPGGTQSSSPTIAHTVAVPLAASVSVGAIVLGVVLAIVGGLLSGSVASWQVTRLQPSQALTRVT